MDQECILDESKGGQLCFLFPFHDIHLYFTYPFHTVFNVYVYPFFINKSNPYCTSSIVHHLCCYVKQSTFHLMSTGGLWLAIDEQTFLTQGIGSEILYPVIPSCIRGTLSLPLSPTKRQNQCMDSLHFLLFSKSSAPACNFGAL